MAKAQSKRAQRLASELETLYQNFNHAQHLERDPLGLVSRHLSPSDFEWVSFITAGLSYGRVEQIQVSVRSLWKRLEEVGLQPGGGRLYEFIVQQNERELRISFNFALQGWVHRFNQGQDITALAISLKRLSSRFPSLGAQFSEAKNASPTERIQLFCASLRDQGLSSEDAARLRWFTCSPTEGSTCKRLMMWLRWMQRHDAIDPGLWTLGKVEVGSANGIGPHAAFIPIDTHVQRWAVVEKIVRTKTATWRTVEQVTQFLRTLNSDDPIRFDFSICHQGMINFRGTQNA